MATFELGAMDSTTFWLGIVPLTLALVGLFLVFRPRKRRPVLHHDRLELWDGPLATACFLLLGVPLMVGFGALLASDLLRGAAVWWPPPAKDLFGLLLMLFVLSHGLSTTVRILRKQPLMLATTEAIWIWAYLGYRRVDWSEIERFEVVGGVHGAGSLVIQYRQREAAKRLIMHLDSVHGLDIETLEESFHELARRRAPRLER
jgi:hypothetical protein